MIRDGRTNPHYHTKDGDIIYASDRYSEKLARPLTKAEFDSKLASTDAI